MRIKKIVVLIAALTFFLSCVQEAYSGVGTDTLGEQTGYNIILISMDTLRYDHLGSAGYCRNTSPNIDKLLAKEGIVFTQAVSQSNWTLPANISLLTSQYVPRHNVDRAFKRLDDAAVTAAEILSAYGYRTAAFTGGFHLSHIFGVDQGFQVYYDKEEHSRLDDLLPLVLDWIKNNKAERFFLFLQAYDCHAPFDIPVNIEHMYDPDYQGIMDNFIFDYSLGDLINGNTLTDPLTGEVHHLTEEDIDHIIAHYDAAINYMDNQIGRFLTELQKLRLADNTVIVFLGNHGEELMDHGGRILKRKHGDAYEEGIRVPLIIKHPGLKRIRGQTINRQVQLIDVIPTILDFLNIPVSHSMQGGSLLPLIEGRAPADFNEYVFTGGYNKQLPIPFSEHMAIRTNEWKL
ncbi:MAG: sulfatase, partial [Candidatus Omnitrophota bacterium]